MTALPTLRDVLILTGDDTATVAAVDSCGGIGSLSQDVLAVALPVVGALTARTALLEVLCTGAAPQWASVAICNSPQIAEQLLEGVRAVLGDAFPLILSTEKNMPTGMTGLGVTVSGSCPKDRLLTGRCRSGDILYCAGLPLVGAEVLEAQSKLPTTTQLQVLLSCPEVHGALPVGSQGIAAEAVLLAKESGLTARLDAPAAVDLCKSAGPSSCVLLAAEAGTALPQAGVTVRAIGQLL